MAKLVLKLGDESLIFAARLKGRSQFLQRGHERLGDENTAIWAKMPLRVGKRMLTISHRRCELL
jgi:hypothetical protein